MTEWLPYPLVTKAEAGVLIWFNISGILLTAMAWRVSDLDVAEAYAWTLGGVSQQEFVRRRHNRLLGTKDARNVELMLLLLHACLLLVGLFWLLTPQPVNPAVQPSAVAIRAVMILGSWLMIHATIHHLVARWRFNRPWTSDSLMFNFWPAIGKAWRETLDSLRPPSEVPS